MIQCPFCDPTIVGIELAFSAIVIILCLLIYAKTKKLYDLTGHKGIRYFRSTFLFFALAFLFRFAFHLFSISGLVFDFRFPREIMGPLPLLVTSYLSTIAIFYLLLSLLWKKVQPEQFLGIAHVAAFSVAVIVFMFHSPYVLAVVQLVLIASALVMAYFKSRHSKGFARLFIIYLLLFIGWLADIVIMSPRWRIPFEFKLLSYVVSVLVFGLIFYKVYRWVK